MKPKRIEYIDVAKFLAMILVVFTHGVKESNFVAFAFAFHLPVFFVLNGMTLKVENQKFGDFSSGTSFRCSDSGLFAFSSICSSSGYSTTPLSIISF